MGSGVGVETYCGKKGTAKVLRDGHGAVWLDLVGHWEDLASPCSESQAASEGSE